MDGHATRSVRRPKQTPRSVPLRSMERIRRSPQFRAAAAVVTVTIARGAGSRGTQGSRLFEAFVDIVGRFLPRELVGEPGALCRLDLRAPANLAHVLREESKRPFLLVSAGRKRREQPRAPVHHLDHGDA